MVYSSSTSTPWSRPAEGLEALLKAMQSSRAATKTAYELLECLTFPNADAAMIAAKMRKMQAVLHCSRLLCPQLPAAETQLIARGGHIHWSCDSPADKHSHGQMQLTLDRGV